VVSSELLFKSVERVICGKEAGGGGVGAGRGGQSVEGGAGEKISPGGH
jgi:hypothetical protein